MSEDLLASRRETLLQHGAAGAVVDELIAYNQNRFDSARAASLALPLADEPHLVAWTEYIADADRSGVVPALRRRFVQMLFPVEAGISQTDVYKAATRKGERPEAPGPGPALRDPDGIELVVNPTVAGRIPLIIASDRADFETLVRVFSGRNEPIPVPPSMGACIVTGLNNWDRVSAYRAAFEARNGSAGDEAAWLEEFQKNLVPNKPLYQDRFIILSRGPYSAVPAKDAGRPEDEWRRLSVEIRREHECTHYFTCRVFGSMRNNLLDEIIADFAGLLRVFGAYDGDLALRFFGLEDHPSYREGGRLQFYLGDPPLSEPAVAVLRNLVHQAVRNIENFADGHELLENRDAAGRMVVALSAMTLEELAAPDMAARIDDVLRPPQRLRISVPGSDEGVMRVLEGFESFLARNPVFEPLRADFGVVLDEVVSNVVKYGYGGDSEKSIVLEALVRPDSLEVAVIDEAPPFNPLERATPDTTQELSKRPIGGLGIHIVKELMDDVEYRRIDNRNRLRFSKRLAPR